MVSQSPAIIPASRGGPPHGSIVVGLGNEIMGDDGVGIWTAQELTKLLAACADVNVVCLPWAGFALLDVLVGKEKAVIVDCVCTGTYPPGTIIRLQEDDLCGSVRLNSFHDINYPTVMRFGRCLGWSLPSSIAIWGIEGQMTDLFHEGLSPAVQRAAGRVIADVLVFLGVPVCATAYTGCGNNTNSHYTENAHVLKSHAAARKPCTG